MAEAPRDVVWIQCVVGGHLPPGSLLALTGGLGEGLGLAELEDTALVEVVDLVVSTCARGEWRGRVIEGHSLPRPGCRTRCTSLAPVQQEDRHRRRHPLSHKQALTQLLPQLDSYAFLKSAHTPSLSPSAAPAPSPSPADMMSCLSRQA